MVYSFLCGGRDPTASLIAPITIYLRREEFHDDGDIPPTCTLHSFSIFNVNDIISTCPSLPNDQLKVSLRRRAHHHGVQSRLNCMNLSDTSRNFLNPVTKKLVHWKSSSSKEGKFRKKVGIHYLRPASRKTVDQHIPNASNHTS